MIIVVTLLQEDVPINYPTVTSTTPLLVRITHNGPKITAHGHAICAVRFLRLNQLLPHSK
jgi:hypothetical protein